MQRRKQLEQIEEAVIKRLREVRVAAGMSQAALAQKAGISRPTVGHTENKRTRPTLWVLLSLAEALDLELPDLISDAMRAVRESPEHRPETKRDALGAHTPVKVGLKE